MTRVKSLARNAVDDLRPRLAVVGRLVEIGLVVLQLVARGRHVGRAGVVRRRVDDADERELGQVGRRHLGPRRAVVARHLHEAVVRAGPEHAGLLRRLGEREDGGVPLRAVGLARDRPPEFPRRRIQVRRRLLERLGIGAREIRADHFPALALVARAVHHLRRDVERLGIVRRHHHRKGPPEAEVDVGRAPAVVRLGVGRDVAHLLGAPVVAVQPVMVGGVDDVRVGGVRGDVAVFAAAHGFPFLDGDAAVVGAARHRDGGVVLLRRVERGTAPGCRRPRDRAAPWAD